MNRWLPDVIDRHEYFILFSYMGFRQHTLTQIQPRIVQIIDKFINFWFAPKIYCASSILCFTCFFFCLKLGVRFASPFSRLCFAWFKCFGCHGVSFDFFYLLSCNTYFEGRGSEVLLWDLT